MYSRFKTNGRKVPYMVTVLIITASHQTFSGQFWCLSGQNKFDLTHLLYIINGKVSVFLEDKVMSGQISTLIIRIVVIISPIPSYGHDEKFEDIMSKKGFAKV